MYIFSLDLGDRVGNLGSLLGTNCLCRFMTGTLAILADMAYEPKTGVDWTTGAKGPMFLVGSILRVLPSIALIPGGGGYWTTTGEGGGLVGDGLTGIGEGGGEAAGG